MKHFNHWVAAKPCACEEQREGEGVKGSRKRTRPAGPCCIIGGRVKTIGLETYCESFGQFGTEIVEHNGDNVLVRDVCVARLEVHLPHSHEIQGILKGNL